MSNLQPRRNSVFYIYNMFKYYLFYAMRERDSYKCWYSRHHEVCGDYILYFKAVSRDGNRKYNLAITLETGTHKYDYIDELINVFEMYRFCEFEISDYDYITDEFNIVFKRVFHNDNAARIYTYSVCNYGLELKDIKEKYCYIPLYEDLCNVYINGNQRRYEMECVDFADTLPYIIESDIYQKGQDALNRLNRLRDGFGLPACDLTINDVRRQLRLPICKELPTYYSLGSGTGFIHKPTLSKPPIFNDPATICYWNDGTKTVVKCQEGDTYSPEAGLALCYMKKILGNTSKDLNKELHKYIPEEKED